MTSESNGRPPPRKTGPSPAAISDAQTQIQSSGKAVESEGLTVVVVTSCTCETYGYCDVCRQAVSA